MSQQQNRPEWGNAAVCLTSAAIVLAVACGGSSVESATSAQAGAVARGTPAGAKLRACDFVDRPAIEAIVGKKVILLHNIESDDLTVCEISDATINSKDTLVYVAVVWKGGKAQVATEKVSMAMAKALMNDKDTDIEKITGSGGVPGLADYAYYSDVMPSSILKGDVLIKITAPTLGGEKTKAVFLSVAKLALAKLPK